MRKIWILSAFLILMGVNSFDFRCNLPDERLRQETKKDQRGVQVSQNPAFAQTAMNICGFVQGNDTISCRPAADLS